MEEISAAQLTANRANGQLSLGPVTAEGKARSSRKAYRHGLTARIIALAEEKQRLEEAILLAKFHKMLNEPFDPQENGCVFSASNLDREIRKREVLGQAALAGKYNFDFARYRFRLEQEAKHKAA
jgi:hypothetical protein